MPSDDENKLKQLKEVWFTNIKNMLMSKDEATRDKATLMLNAYFEAPMKEQPLDPNITINFINISEEQIYNHEHKEEIKRERILQDIKGMEIVKND